MESCEGGRDWFLQTINPPQAICNMEDLDDRTSIDQETIPPTESF
jgi:hypothetical protein